MKLVIAEKPSVAQSLAAVIGAATRKDGYLIGRGVLDDKGPFVLSLYAANFFRRQVEETGEKLPYTLRCIIGNNDHIDIQFFRPHL